MLLQIHWAITSEARSISARLSIGSCSIVYWSASRICDPVRIFIVSFFNARGSTGFFARFANQKFKKFHHHGIPGDRMILRMELRTEEPPVRVLDRLDHAVRVAATRNPSATRLTA